MGQHEMVELIYLEIDVYFRDLDVKDYDWSLSQVKFLVERYYLG